MSEKNDLPNHQTLLDTEMIQIYYNFIDDWLYAKWSGDHTMETVQSGCEQILFYFKMQRCHKLLNDDRETINLFWPAQDWLINDFAPRMAEAGLKNVAWVYSHQVYGRLSTDIVITNLPSGIMSIAFENLEEAKDWLRSV